MRAELKIKSTTGLHASLAAKVVQLSSKYDANVIIQYNDMTVDAKSILGLISLAIPKGENITVIVEGNDSEKALNDFKKILS